MSAPILLNILTELKLRDKIQDSGWSAVFDCGTY